LITEDSVAGAKSVQQLAGDLCSNNVHNDSCSSSSSSSSLSYQVVTAVWLPYGDDDSSEMFWSYKLGLRHINSHALVNAALHLSWDQPQAASNNNSSSSSSSGPASSGEGSQARTSSANGSVAAARVFVGFQPPRTSNSSSPSSSSSSSSTGTASSCPVEDPWRLMRLTAVEEQLQGRPVTVKVRRQRRGGGRPQPTAHRAPSPADAFITQLVTHTS
jgi:hypothetical protein